MCLATKMTGKKKKAAIAALPETFSVWKRCPSGEPEFRVGKDQGLYKYKNEPVLAQKRWYKARKFPQRRVSLTYKPGFHAYLATEGFGFVGYHEFMARRKDVAQIGIYNGKKCVVLDWIRPV